MQSKVPTYLLTYQCFDGLYKDIFVQTVCFSHEQVFNTSRSANDDVTAFLFELVNVFIDLGASNE